MWNHPETHFWVCLWRCFYMFNYGRETKPGCDYQESWYWGPRLNKRKPSEYNWSLFCAHSLQMWYDHDLLIASSPAMVDWTLRWFFKCVIFSMYGYFAWLFPHCGSLQTGCCIHSHLLSLSSVTTGSFIYSVCWCVSGLKHYLLPLEQCPS